MKCKLKATIETEGLEELQVLLDRHDEISREMQSNVDAIRCKLLVINCTINNQSDEADKTPEQHMDNSTNTTIDHAREKEIEWLKDRLTKQMEMLSINSTRRMVYNELANLSNTMVALGELLFSMQRYQDDQRLQKHLYPSRYPGRVEEKKP